MPKTPSRHRSFSPKNKNDALDPVTFDLAGENFTAYPKLPGAVILEFISATDEGSATTAGALIKFLKDAMDDGNFSRLNAIFHDKEIMVEIEDIADIVSYLVEEYSDRPTEAS